MIWFSIPSAGLLSASLPCHFYINVVKLSLAELLVNPALIDLPNCTLLFSLLLSINWSTGQGVWRANTFIMLAANKIWITLQGIKLNLQFPLVDVIKYWFKTRGDTAAETAYWLSRVVLPVFCKGCLLSVPVCLAGKEWLVLQEIYRMMERQKERLGVFLFVGPWVGYLGLSSWLQTLKTSLYICHVYITYTHIYIYLIIFCGWGLPSKPTSFFPQTHCPCSTFPAYFWGFRGGIFRCFV